MKKLHLLIVKSFIGPFVVTFFISLFLFLMQFLWKYIGDLVGKGLEWYIILEFIMYSSAYLIPMALPLAVLLSSIMTFGNLGEQYELVAIKSAGVSLIAAMRPMFAVLTILALAAFYSSNILIPKANLNWGALLYDVTHKKPALNIKDGVFFKDIEGYAIRVGKKHDDNQTIENILIYAGTDSRGSTDVILARRGKMVITPDERYLQLVLNVGVRYQEMTENRNYHNTFPHNTMRFQEYNMSIDLSELQFKRTKKELFKEDYRMLNVKELQQRIDSLAIEVVKRNQYLVGYLSPYFHFSLDTLKPPTIFKLNTTHRFSDSLGHFARFIVQRDKQQSVLNEPEPVHSIMLRRRTNKLKEAQFTSMPQVGVTNPDLADVNRNREQIIEEALKSNKMLESIVAGQKEETEDLEYLISRYATEWHKKFTLAISCILLFFIGAPLGSIIRKGGFGLPLVISILLFIVYFVINVVGEKLAKEAVLSNFQGMWLSTFILLPVAIFLTYKASTDSKLFDWDSYKRFFRKLRIKKA
jgi:lipopolysaccharide export system permease protein